MTSHRYNTTEKRKPLRANLSTEEKERRIVERAPLLGGPATPPRVRMFKSMYKLMGPPESATYQNGFVRMGVERFSTELGDPFTPDQLEEIVDECEEARSRFTNSEEGLKSWKGRRDGLRGGRRRRGRARPRWTHIINDYESGLTQVQCAGKWGVSQQRVSQILQEHRNTKITKAPKPMAKPVLHTSTSRPTSTLDARIEDFLSYPTPSMIEGLQNDLQLAQRLFGEGAKDAYLDLAEWVGERQKRMGWKLLRLLGTGQLALCREYLEWVESQHWITTKNTSGLSPTSKIFQLFRQNWRKYEVMGRDPVTGEDSD